MVVGTYMEWHSFTLRLRRRRRAIEELGIGRLLLPFSPSVTPKVRPPELACATFPREGIPEPLYTDRVGLPLRVRRSGKAPMKATNG